MAEKVSLALTLHLRTSEDGHYEDCKLLNYLYAFSRTCYDFTGMKKNCTSIAINNIIDVLLGKML